MRKERLIRVGMKPIVQETFAIVGLSKLFESVSSIEETVALRE